MLKHDYHGMIQGKKLGFLEKAATQFVMNWAFSFARLRICMIMDRILHAVALICHEMPVAVASISLRTWWNCMIADRIYVRIYALKCNIFFFSCSVYPLYSHYHVSRPENEETWTSWTRSWPERSGSWVRFRKMPSRSNWPDWRQVPAAPGGRSPRLCSVAVPSSKLRVELVELKYQIQILRRNVRSPPRFCQTWNILVKATSWHLFIRQVAWELIQLQRRYSQLLDKQLLPRPWRFCTIRWSFRTSQGNVFL